MVKDQIKSILYLKFLPNVSLFLFGWDFWARLQLFKKFIYTIDVNNQKRIIDVGAGSGNLENELKRNDIFLYDINENLILKAKNSFKNAFSGSGTDINFPDNSFDWGISFHTLEHIKINDRDKFLYELIRVSEEGIFLNFPFGGYAESLCINYLTNLKRKKLKLNKHTIEHLQIGLPEIQDILNILENQNKFIFGYKTLRNYQMENYYWWINTFRNKFLKFILRPAISILCYLYKNKNPAVEVVIVGAKEKKTINGILKNF